MNAYIVHLSRSGVGKRVVLAKDIKSAIDFTIETANKEAESPRFTINDVTYANKIAVFSGTAN